MAISEPYAANNAVWTTDEDWSLTGDDNTIDTITDDGVYQVFIDFNALVDGDQWEVKFWEKVQSTGTQRQFWSAVISNNQGENDIWVSPSMILLHGWDVTLTQLTATDRDIEWSIRKVA